jgi:nucleotide-binding universal stress UspA family protein
MAQVNRIIAATDFSPAADRAMRRAVSLAATLGGVLHLLHVLPPRALLESLFEPERQREVDAIRERAAQALQERALRSAATLGVTPTCELLHGSAHQSILDAVDSLAADLVVMGAQGEHEGTLKAEGAGETAMKVAGLSRVPTLLVRREPFAHYSRVMGCVAGVPSDRPVVEWASTVSPSDLIHFATAYSVPYQNRLTEWGASSAMIDVYAKREHDLRTRETTNLIQHMGLLPARFRLHAERGETVETLLRTAAQWRADLVILGRRARAGTFPSGPLASVARHVTLRVAADVMIVPPSERAVAL